MSRESAEILAYFNSTIDPELEQKPGAGKENGLPNGENSAQSYLQNTLAKLGPRVMGIRLLLGEDHAYAIVVTANTRKKIRIEGHAGRVAQQSF